MDSYQLRAIILKLQDRLSDNDRKRLHFFLGNDVPRRIRDDPSLSGTLSLMESLFDQDKISDRDFTFLINAFDEIQCTDAVRLLREHMRRMQENGQHESIQSLTAMLLYDQDEDRYSMRKTLINQQNSYGDNRIVIDSNTTNINPATTIINNQSSNFGQICPLNLLTRLLLLFVLLLIIGLAVLFVRSIRENNHAVKKIEQFTELVKGLQKTQRCNAIHSQCGGIGWTGSTTCCSKSRCTYENDYYWKCLLPKSGVTTRYWDCCKASCGWPGKASVTTPVQTCTADGVTPVDNNTQSVCNGGSAYMCNNQQPWNVSSTLSYGYAAADIIGQSESTWCCACYSLIFTPGVLVGKQLIVQVTNTGDDLGNNHFNLQIPGGGVNIFDGCTNLFGSIDSWGGKYGGVSQRSDCDRLPVVLRSGCYWRFDWFMNADNPTMTFTRVTCPSVLTANTQCIRV